MLSGSCKANELEGCRSLLFLQGSDICSFSPDFDMKTKEKREESLRRAERDVARHESARLRQLFVEIRCALHDPGAADDKVRWLIDRLESFR